MNEFGIVEENINLKKYTTFKVGGTVKYLIKPYDEDSLSKLIKYINEKKYKYILLGNGSNVILDDNYFDGIVIKFDNFNNIDINDNIINCGAGVNLHNLVNYTFENGYSDLYFLSMIPGNVGGSIVGNAGCYGDEIINYVKNVTVMDKEGNIKKILKEDISFGYRYTSLKNKYIVLNVEFVLNNKNVDEVKKILKEKNLKRINSQPLEYPSVGSIFRNPDGYFAGKLIEDANLKGTSIGDAFVSSKHANFIINKKNATFNDIIKLINIIKDTVKEKYNIDLVLEPNIIKWDEL